MSKKCTPLWREARFWKLRCRKSARHFGAKHVSKSKCTKHTIVGPLLEVEMSKKCTPIVARSTFRSENVQSTPLSDHFWKLRCRKKRTPLWREAHFEVKMYKAPHVRATFGGSDVEKVHAVVARSTFRSQNVKNTRGLDHFWRFRCRFASLHYTTLHYTTLQYTTLHYTLHYLPLHFTTLHYTTLRYTTLRYTTLHYTTLHPTTLQLQLRLRNYTPLRSTALLHYTTFHYMDWWSSTQSSRPFGYDQVCIYSHRRGLTPPSSSAWPEFPSC